MLNLDTHILLYALTDDLTRRERALLASDTWSISAIVLWEISKLSELGRIEVDLDHPELTRTLARIDSAEKVFRQKRRQNFSLTNAAQSTFSVQLIIFLIPNFPG